MSILALLIGLVLFCALYWGAMKILAAFGIGNPVATIVQVVIVLLAIVWLMSAFGVGPNLNLR